MTMTEAAALLALRKQPLQRPLLTTAEPKTPVKEPAVPTVVPLTPPAPASKEAQVCRYRNNRCSQPRTTKKNGQLHSYCAFHRHRSVVNQRRFDEKKRMRRMADAEANPQKAVDRCKQRHARQNKNAHKRAPSATKKSQDPKPTSTALPSFDSFVASIAQGAKAKNLDAWLLLFQASGASSQPSDAMWRAMDIPHFFQTQ